MQKNKVVVSKKVRKACSVNQRNGDYCTGQ